MSFRLVSVVALVFAASACSSSSTGDRGGSGGSAGASGSSGSGTGGSAGGSAGGTTGGAGGGKTLLPATCFAGSAACNPVDNTGCPPEQQCDFNGKDFVCRPQTKNAPTGGNGCSQPANHCAPGFICDQGPLICSKMCCNKADCGPLNCIKLPGGQLSLGFCKP